MTEEEKGRRARPGVDAAPLFVRLVRITGGGVVEGPWHDLEPAGWPVNAVRAVCGARARTDHFDTTDKPGRGARFCSRCRARRREKAAAT